MSEFGENPQMPERGRIKDLAESVFPQSTWESLPLFDPASIPETIARLADSEMYEAMKEAIQKKKGAAHRMDFFPTKLRVAAELAGCALTQETINRTEVADLLDSDEQIGGVAIKAIAWPARLPNRDTLNNPDNVFDYGLVRVIGVLDSNGKPIGVIHYKEGPRDKQRQTNKDALTLPKLGLQGI